MGTGYKQLSLEDRCEIARLHQAGCSIRKIAASLDRTPSTIARELKRNTGRKTGYRPGYANEQSRARRWKGSKLERNPKLRKAVFDCLARGWSPEQVAGRMSRETGADFVSHETIYRFIYAEIARTKDYRWRLYLPRSKSKRGCRGQRGGSPVSFIEKRLSIHHRPAEAEDRNMPGHWEADLMAFSKYGQNILTLHERQSRFMIAARPQNKTADLIAEHIKRLLEPLPAGLRQTLTFDNGTEFARHHWLHTLGFETFFCDPYSPWQKGGIENAIGRMRRHLPRKTDLATLDDTDFLKALQTYNRTPRKCLDFKTPAEVLLEKLLHFKCESTSPPSRG